MPPTDIPTHTVPVRDTISNMTAQLIEAQREIIATKDRIIQAKDDTIASLRSALEAQQTIIELLERQQQQ